MKTSFFAFVFFSSALAITSDTESASSSDGEAPLFDMASLAKLASKLKIPENIDFGALMNDENISNVAQSIQKNLGKKLNIDENDVKSAWNLIKNIIPDKSNKNRVRQEARESEI